MSDTAATSGGVRDDTTILTASGQDWDEVVTAAAAAGEDHIVVNMGPQHPSTHGVLRLVLEIEGETVTEARCSIGYLHTGIEKNLEYRNWTQGVTFVTRMDYLVAVLQRDCVLPRRRETARHHPPRPRAGRPSSG